MDLLALETDEYMAFLSMHVSNIICHYKKTDGIAVLPKPAVPYTWPRILAYHNAQTFGKANANEAQAPASAPTAEAPATPQGAEPAATAGPPIDAPQATAPQAALAPAPNQTNGNKGFTTSAKLLNADKQRQPRFDPFTGRPLNP